MLRAKAKEQQARKPESVVQNSAEQIKPTKTRKELAKIAGVSHDTVSKASRCHATAAATDFSNTVDGVMLSHSVACSGATTSR